MNFMKAVFYTDNPDSFKDMNNKTVFINGDEVTIVVKQKTKEEKIDTIIRKLYDFCRNRESCYRCCYLNTEDGNCIVKVPHSWEIDK